MKTLVLALGNPILSDDRVGHEIADRIAKSTGDFDIIKSSAATMDIVPKLAGYDRLVIIDAIQLGTAAPGTVHFFTLDDFVGTIRKSSPHDINFATAIQTAKEWGYDVPEDVRIYAIEAKELLKFSESCTPQIQNKLDEITNRILKDISNDTS
ncbi:MAG: hydrogenase maturation protease [Planctomycetota bacterium]|jgi:hydrogenase maturation protease